MTFSVKSKDGNTIYNIVQIVKLYIEQQRIYFYREEDTKKVDFNVDKYYVYDSQIIFILDHKVAI